MIVSNILIINSSWLLLSVNEFYKYFLLIKIKQKTIPPFKIEKFVNIYDIYIHCKYLLVYMILELNL